jgi:hypothetical protein
VEYLPEWIECHKKQGVQHFYLYNNRSPDDYKKILSPYIKNKTVEVFDWNFNHENDGGKWISIQCGAYMDCINKISGRVKWCAFLDTDEFLFNPQGKNLNKLLKKYELYGGIGVNWVMYGTSGVDKIPKGENMVDHLIMRAKLGYAANKHIKCIVRPEYVSQCLNPHFFFMYPPKHIVTENFERNVDCMSKQHSVNIFRINHYWTRDEHFMHNKKIPRRRSWGYDDAIIEANKELNSVRDEILSDLSHSRR